MTIAAIVVGVAITFGVVGTGTSAARARRLAAGGRLRTGLRGATAPRPSLSTTAHLLRDRAHTAWAALARSRREVSYDTTLAAALDAMARVVRGGASLPLAVHEGARAVRGIVADDLQRVAAASGRGERLEVALAEWRAGRDRASVRLAAGAITLAATTGGPPARVIEDVASSLRMRMQIEGEARALGAQARLSALVVGVAPVVFAVVSCAVDPRNARLMFGTPIGLACLAVGLVLDVVGAVWMHRVSETVLS